MGRRGGMGYPGGGGGGYPGGGGGYPGGGGGYPRGGSGGGGAMPIDGTIRWESAKPVQEAQARLKSLNASSDSRPSDEQADRAEGHKPDAKLANDYVIALLGVRTPGSRSRYNDDDDNSRSNQSGYNRQTYDDLMSGTQLVMKNKTPIAPEDVKFNTQNGQSEILFYFPKTSPITLDDKEVTFHTMINRTKLEHKFDLKKMTRNGKLELD